MVTLFIFPHYHCGRFDILYPNVREKSNCPDPPAAAPDDLHDAHRSLAFRENGLCRHRGKLLNSHVQRLCIFLKYRWF